MDEQVNTVEQVHQTFKAGFEMLPAKYQSTVRDNIIYRCGLTYTSFYNRITGISKIKKLEIPIIEEEFAKHSINPWTGERTA